MHSDIKALFDITAACEAFKNARREWERSEAFLYGAAANNEIDPHIDSWPLDHDQMVKALNKQDIIAGIKGENPAQFIYTKHEHFESVIGFHGLEFVLFRNGAARTAAMLNANETEAGMTSVKGIDELAFAAAVAGDIYNMTSLLQYGWNGDATLGSWLTSNCNWVVEGLKGLENSAGVEIVVDDTPEAIVISAFDPIRREVCRLALHQLVADGRIHPARIEEVVAKVKKQLENEIIETGKRTAIDLGIHGLHPELIRIIGKMKYRSSYGQNLLQHARETANLCAVMASELGLNPKKAKRAGLLHDIGKVPDEESELPHALYGAKIAEKYKEKPDICNAIGAHHDEMEMNTLLAPIVQVCEVFWLRC